MRQGGPLVGRTVALCVTGSIAAYKAPMVARRLLELGARVLPVMTRAASQFVGPSTFSGLLREPVRQDMWDPTYAGEMHVDLAREADVVAVVPATADVLARIARGRANDVVAALALAFSGPLVLAPAMHPRMWAHAATQANLEVLKRRAGVSVVGPVHGAVASGEVGTGRMAEPEEIVDGIARAVGPRDLAGKRILVTAGPTLEDLDPVRFLGNRSTGKMGFAIAEVCAARGADVILVTGPVDLATPPRVRRVNVRSAIEMREAVLGEAGRNLRKVHAIVMSAAVADYRPKALSPTKLKKGGARLALELVKNPDILAELGRTRKGRAPLLVGFAVETGTDEEIASFARGKLVAKKVDAVIANHARDSFGKETNRVTMVLHGKSVPLEEMSKGAVAYRIADFIASREKPSR